MRAYLIRLGMPNRNLASFESEGADEISSIDASARTSIGVVRIASALQLGELRIDQRRKRVSAAGRDRDSDMFGKVMERAPSLI